MFIQCKAIHFQDGDRYVDVLLLTLFLVFQFLSFISFTEKSQYISRIKSLPLKFGECRYFDVSSLNEERYGTLVRLNLSLLVSQNSRSKNVSLRYIKIIISELSSWGKPETGVNFYYEQVTQSVKIV